MTVVTDKEAAVVSKDGEPQQDNVPRRNFSLFEVFGLAFSIMGPLPSIASTLPFALLSGPAGMIWGWFLASCCIFIVGLAMSDLGSAMPTSGGLYWWTHRYASPKARNYLSWLVGYSNSLGLIGGLCSVDYGFAKMVCSIVFVAMDGAWEPSDGIVFLVFFVCIVTHAVLVSTCSRFIGRLQSFSAALNFIVILATLIALPVGRSLQGKLNTAMNPLHTENLTTWPKGWAFLLSWLSPIWSIGGFASCVNVSEEAANAPKAVPMGIVMSIGNAWILGFIIQIVLVACMDQDIGRYINSPSGQPMTQIYFDAIGKNGAIFFVTLICFVQFFMGLSVLVSVSRQTWAFSRDGALPFSSHLSRLSKSLGSVPFRATWACASVASLLGLLSLADPAAARALFSMATASNNVAWMIPIGSRIIWGQRKFVPGPFFTGAASPWIAGGAVAFLIFGVIVSFFPVEGPGPSPTKMNYTVVVNMLVWISATVYYLVDARKWFKGPDTDAWDKKDGGGDDHDKSHVGFVGPTGTIEKKKMAARHEEISLTHHYHHPQQQRHGSESSEATVHGDSDDGVVEFIMTAPSPTETTPTTTRVDHSE